MKKNKRVINLIMLIIGLLLVLSFPSSVYADIQKISSVTINSFSDNWEQGLKLKKSTASTSSSKTGGATVNSINDFVFDRLGISGYKIYEVRLTNTSQTVTIRYNNIGTHNGTTVDCKATYQATNIDNSSKSKLWISKNFYNGFLYYYLGVKVTYKFYKTGTNTEVKVNNTIFSVNSLNYGEGTKYGGSSTGYVSNNTLVKYENGYFHGTSNNSKEWTDTIGGFNFERATVSFKLTNSASHTIYYKAGWGYNWQTYASVWVSPSTIPAGTPKITPTKKVDKTNAKKGETITYTITQQLHRSGTNYLQDRYSSLRIEDSLPKGLSFKSSSISSSNTKDGGKWKRTKSGQKITYTCQNPGSLKLTGQKITVKIVCTINNKAGATIKNKSSTYINGFRFYSNEVTTNIVPDPPVLQNSIKKTGPKVITNLLEQVTYNIQYSANVSNFSGKAQVEIKDILPYEIDTSKSDLDGGQYNKSDKSITWTVNYNSISSKNTPFNKTISKTIKVVYKDVDGSDGTLENKVYGQIKTTTAPIAQSTRVEDSWESEIPTLTNIEVTKKWEDSTKHGKSRRPKNVQFLLLKNGESTGIFSEKIDISKDSYKYTFKNLPLFDSKGKQIKYDVMEVSKIAGDVPSEVEVSEIVGEIPEEVENSDAEIEGALEEFEDLSDPLTQEEIEDETEWNEDEENQDGENVVIEEPGEDNLSNDDEPDQDGESNPEAEEVETNYIPYNLKNLKGYLIESAEDLMYYQDYVEEEPETYVNKKVVKHFTITNKYTSINIKGNVWKDISVDGKKSQESGFPGVEVQLYFETYNRATNKTQFLYYGYNVRTDKDGVYSFNDIPWNGNYKLRFRYNGQVYESTYYKDDLSGVYSNIKENESIRRQVNNRFLKIAAYPNNYLLNKRAFGVNQKIKNADQSDTNYNFNAESTPYTFNDILNMFDTVDYNINEYNDAFWNSFKSKLLNAGINSNTATKLIDYINDSFVEAATPAAYSANNLSVLKPGDDNTIQLVTAGLAPRKECNLSIKNDVYKVTSIINGKITEDKYDSKDELYEVSQRAENGLYNGQTALGRELYKSDYLYNGEDIGESPKRNLQVFVTYRIKIKNKGKVSALVNSVSDYYDTSNFEAITDIANSSVFKNNTFIGDSNYKKLSELGIVNTGEVFGEGHKYNKLVITGVDSENKNTKLPIKVREGDKEAIESYVLHPEEEADIYITFKVKNDEITKRISLDKDMNNVTEINGYSTVYTPKEDVIPDELGKNDVKINKQISSYVNAGLVDIDSDPGSLLAQDLDENDNLIYKKVQADKIYENMEDDTDKISIKFLVSQDENYVRSIGGAVFEDKRNVNQSDIKTSIGNGYIEDDEVGINGVTVQLVELVSEIDEDGIATENYLKEVVLGSYVYSKTPEGGLKKTSINTSDENDNSYYSGIGLSKVIESGVDEFEVKSKPIAKNSGYYSFESIYPGDFYVRFAYGDSTRTVLTNGENDVNSLLNAVLQEPDKKGLNAKSYNGQDYKSTIYQSGFNNSGHVVSVDQSGNYNGIDGYTSYETQNFSATTNVEKKELMYYYDLQKSNNIEIDGKKIRVSDAKDIYDDRIKVTTYCNDLINSNSEVLNSFERLGSKLGDTQEEQASKQKELIDELINQTKMRSNTGIIDVEYKHNNNTTKEVDLGLVERAKAQTRLSKEVKRIKIVLGNEEVLFDTTKSVNNLYFSKHTSHGTKYEDYKISEKPTINNKNGESTAELLQVYMDKELIDGATMIIDYKMGIKNVGEIDYKDKKYYYTGIEDNPNENIAKTKINKIIDYNTNATTYEEGRQKEGNTWKVVEYDYLLDNKYVSARNQAELKTYDTLIINDGIGKELVPEMFNKKNSETTTELTMSTFLNSGNIADELTYNNTLEIIELKSEIGRREQYSIPGNQIITDQTLGRNAISGESVSDRRVPAEIDADSAQSIVIMPPTGERDYTTIIFAINIGLGVILIGAFVVKELLFKDSNR